MLLQSHFKNISLCFNRTTLTVMIDLELHIHTLLIHPVYIDVDISVSTITPYLDQLFIARLLNVYCEFLL